MSARLRLCLVLHNHQPVGNFDGVFEASFQESYAPFLEVLKDYPGISIGLHTSGSLLEWLVQAHPEYIEELRPLVQSGQIEILGGPFYEPIMACIPRADRVGQIQAYSAYLKNLFDVDVRGMWMPERVWEQGFTGDITRAGIEYTVLDDFHFQASGLRADEMHGYYLTEDEGRLFKIFPGSERLRYTIPFQSPQATIDYLGEIAHHHPGSVVTFGDDGEKFGTWPGTQEHVYQNGWLRQFFDALQANSDWLQVSTPSNALDNVPPHGKIYLTDCSYREMTEWALTTERQQEFVELYHVKEMTSDPNWPALKPYLKGGFWRNFRVKYPESNEMYVRMMELSARLQKFQQSHETDENASLIAEAKTALYRAQCNCPYWHGAFGGLYLPHLRNAIYYNLILADNLLEKAEGKAGRWVEASVADFNLDARQEVRLISERLIGYLSPARGGHLYELDIRQTRHNMLATLNRRPEPYHEKIRNAAHQQHHDHGGATSIHDLVHFKQPDLDKKLFYDNWPRKSLVDHFLQPGLTQENFNQGHGAVADFAEGVYEARLLREDDFVQVVLSRVGNVGPHQVRVVKTVKLSTSSSSSLDIEYELENLPADVPLHFGVEFNFAGMAAGASDRYYYGADGGQLGQLETQHSLQQCDRVGLVDEWLGTDVCLELDRPAALWLMPVETISQSEGGFEAVHQSCSVVPHWEFTSPDDGRWTVKMTLSVNTSAAQARLLREAAEIAAQNHPEMKTVPHPE